MLLQSCACSIWRLVRIIVVVELVIGLGQAKDKDWCDVECKSEGDKTTMCKYPKPTLDRTRCKKFKETLSKLTPCQQEEIVKFHNERRSVVASGKEIRGAKGLPQPPASNMMELIWDDQMAEIAIRFARQCKYLSQDECLKLKNGTDFGQNLGLEFDQPPNKLHPLQEFYDEAQDFPPKQVNGFISQSTGKTVKHYTQIVWANTRVIGCGLAYYSKGGDILSVVCNYYPAGNVDGKPVYLNGTGCSKCPKDSGCSNKYPGLCKNPYAPEVDPCAPNTTTTKPTTTETTTTETTTTETTTTRTTTTMNTPITSDQTTPTTIETTTIATTTTATDTTISNPNVASTTTSSVQSETATSPGQSTTQTGDGITSAIQETTMKSPRIMGGTAVKDITHYPFMAHVQESCGRHLSGASIISTLWILTKADVVDSPLHMYRVVAGVLDTINLEEVCDGPVQIRFLAHVILSGGHERLALLKLTSELEFGPNVKAVTLPPEGDSSTLPWEGKECTALGWGLTESGLFSPVLLKVNIPVISQEKCKKKILDDIAKVLLCTQKDGKAPCVGDVGGPLICDGVQVGVHIYYTKGLRPEECHRPGFTVGWVRTDLVLDWIHEAMKKNLLLGDPGS